MSAHDAVLGKPRAARAAASMVSRHREFVPALAILAAWATLSVRGGQSAGMDMAVHRAGAWGTAAAGLPAWMLMTIAMMGPAALARFRHVGRAGSYAGIAGFAVGYLTVWAAFGLLALSAAAALASVPGTGALALALLAAAGWQLSPVKRGLLRGCHRSHSPREDSLPGGAALVRGLRYGTCCLGACWCLMLVMVAAPGGELLWLAGLTALIAAERVLPDPDAATRAVAAALGVAAVATLAVGGLL